MGEDAVLLGRVGGDRLHITANGLLLDIPVSELEHAYKAPFKEY